MILVKNWHRAMVSYIYHLILRSAMATSAQSNYQMNMDFTVRIIAGAFSQREPEKAVLLKRYRCNSDYIEMPITGLVAIIKIKVYALIDTYGLTRGNLEMGYPIFQ